MSMEQSQSWQMLRARSWLRISQP